MTCGLEWVKRSGALSSKMRGKEETAALQSLLQFLSESVIAISLAAAGACSPFPCFSILCPHLGARRPLIVFSKNQTFNFLGSVSLMWGVLVIVNPPDCNGVSSCRVSLRWALEPPLWEQVNLSVG